MLNFDINAKNILTLFDKITRHGTLVDGRYQLNGITASSDFDGYTIYLSSPEVSVSLYFHNSFDVKCDSDKSLQHFKSKALKIQEIFGNQTRH